MVDEAARGPLAGRTVIELAGIGPGPFACMVLADMGADVIRVDRPIGGAVPAATTADVLNRNKRSIVLDLKRPEAVDAILGLVERADVLVEGYRPGVAERLGIGPDAVWARKPKLVYGRMTGWGQEGPLAHSAGHDIGYIALTGALHAIGEADGPPQIPLNLVGDFGGGSTYLVMGVLAALLEAERTGRGQVVDAAIVDGAAHLMAVIHALLGAGRWEDRRGVNMLDGGTPYYAVYETSDGRHMAVGALEPKFFAELLRLLDVPESTFAPRDRADRSRWPELRAILADRFAGRTQAEWSELFDGTDACVAPVLGLRAAATHPHVAARGSLVEVEGVLQPGAAPRFSGHAATPPAPAPAPGRDTRAVLAAAGLDADALLAEGVALQAE
ncbi:CaiB/BaiF CoA-transferase family protein [Pseudonocardia halophobica]|uniref:CoA transferase n=1 Tax=Pseudonocardia halophobica TaxID=29401 RepID=A0A9W6L2G5_9PSEU|nr:CaiB/BaiF CoA-transferase family protein [Pseudonocardia halophobica]GLL09834.1 CoA transferase [Pseudonocardia halophobica]